MTHVPEAASAFFGSLGESYDTHARRGIPRYEEMLETLAGYLPGRADRVLELGCGTGGLTLRLAKRLPTASLTLVDGSREMIEITRARLRAEHPEHARRAHFRTEPFETLALEPAAFDLVTASMSLHHLAEKLPFYRRLHRTLRPGALLLFADELTGALPHVEQLHWNAWLEFARRPGNLSAEELAATLRHVEEHDHYETLSDQLSLLAWAGFRRVDCVWRQLNYAIFAALP